MFIDRTNVIFSAGKGGDGSTSFRREKFIPKGGPDGGDGGDGGDIVLISRKNVSSLIDFKSNHHIKAGNGGNGSGNNRSGKHGENRIMEVPAGTIVKTFPEEEVIFDFNDEGIEFVIAKGGKSGAGNVRFKSSINQAPTKAKKGKPGESIRVILELKLIAFAGLVGFPNAGKSTLISKLSGARPKIADYPFTTLTPHLGVVYQGYESLVIADIPGIIEGAHKGEGMGTDFLRHIERNRVLVFLINLGDASGADPVTRLKILLNELRSYKKELLRKRHLVVANKIDLLDNVEESNELLKLREYCGKEGLELLEISALKEINLNRLKNKLFKLLNED
ncbi:MAG: GTPase ObgE [Candidatus Aminicenantes bacterium]|nr:GTPase ObgE [Candidatus Aminicenantes bacterium]